MEGALGPRAAFAEVVRQVRIASALPSLDPDHVVTAPWIEWLTHMDEALEHAESAVRGQSFSQSLAFRRLREELDRAVVGKGARLYVDTDAVESTAVRALRLTMGVAKSA